MNHGHQSRPDSLTRICSATLRPYAEPRSTAVQEPSGGAPGRSDGACSPCVFSGGPHWPWQPSCPSPSSPAEPARADTQWSGTLTQAIDHLPVAGEVRTGYDRDLFNLRVDANDLDDSHTLVGVTASLNRSKGDQDVGEWMPPINHCRYVKDWLTAKVRWGLSQDATEKAAVQDIAAGCTNSTITVTVVG